MHFYWNTLFFHFLRAGGYLINKITMRWFCHVYVIFHMLIRHFCVNHVVNLQLIAHFSCDTEQKHATKLESARDLWKKLRKNDNINVIALIYINCIGIWKYVAFGFFFVFFGGGIIFFKQGLKLVFCDVSWSQFNYFNFIFICFLRTKKLWQIKEKVSHWNLQIRSPNSSKI